MNRRQFFKTLAATTAGVVAVGVAPRVAGKRMGWDHKREGALINPNPSEQRSNSLIQVSDTMWVEYHKVWPAPDPKLLKRFEVVCKSHKFNYPFGKPI